MKKIDSIYLDKLEYDPKLDHSPFKFFLDRVRFLFLFIIVITIAWLISLRSLPLESTPEVQIWVWVIATVLPWASPEVVEDLVTKKIEKEVSKIKGIDTISSTSMNSISSIVIQLKSDANISDTMREIKDKVDLTKSSLPADAKDPIVREISFSDQPIWTFSVAWSYDGFTLYKYAEKIKDEIEKNPLVSEVNIAWWDEAEYSVQIDPKKLESYGLTINDVNTAIKSKNIAFPIWDYDVWNYTHTMNIDERFYTIEDIKNIIVTKLGTTGIIRVSDVAEVKEVAKKRITISRLSYKGSMPENAVTLWVVKKRWGSIVTLVDDWKLAIEEMRKSWILPEDITITTIIDNSERIKLDLHHLIRDWLITIWLVFGILFLVIWIKEALVAWTVAPLVFLITFAVMAIAGQTLNFLSMFALILSLGLLVDDAIVVISAINQYKRTWKFTTKQAALLVLRDYKKVLISTTLTVVWIFSAMMFMTGIIWKFIFSIPFVITITLLASLVIAMTINPWLAVFFDRFSKSNGKESWISKWLVNLEKLENLYWKIISKLVSKRRYAWYTVFISIIVFISALALPITGLLKSEFFPQTDQDIFMINIESEAGKDLESTSGIAQKVEEVLMQEKEIYSFSTTIWASSSLEWRSWWTNSSHHANISVNLIKKEYWRKESSISIAERLRNEVKSIKDAKVTVSELKWWPPAWADFELKIAWDNFQTLEQIANDVKATLQTIPWVINIETSRKPLPLEFKLDLDGEKLALYDITVPQVASFIKNITDSTEVTKIYKQNKEILVKTRYEEGSVNTIEKLQDAKIRNNRGQDVYLRDLITNKLSPSVFSIERYNQKRILTVSASATKQTNSTLIKNAFDEKMKSYKIPSGYEFISGGANEENAKSVKSLLVAMLFGMFFIIGTLVILFDSYRQSVLVLVTIPLSLIWVFYWLTLFGQSLSFPSLIWLVALFGIVVRNGIILFDKINLNLKENIWFQDSIIDAGKTRLEPVLLTSVCTIFGMIPLTLSNPMWTGLWLSIIFGLASSTVFTLLLLPTLYYLAFRRKYKNTNNS
jgi:multidrug efflux pump subunit AcrB